MRHAPLHISLLFLLVLSLLSCDKTPRGVISVNDMADLIVDLKIADVYIEKHRDEFPDDSSKLVLKQSVFKKYGITSEDYDSSLVWYAHNMEDYIKAHDQAVLILQKRMDKLTKNEGKDQVDESRVSQDRWAASSVTCLAMMPIPIPSTCGWAGVAMRSIRERVTASSPLICLMRRITSLVTAMSWLINFAVVTMTSR